MNRLFTGVMFTAALFAVAPSPAHGQFTATYDSGYYRAGYGQYVGVPYPATSYRSSYYYPSGASYYSPGNYSYYSPGASYSYQPYAGQAYVNVPAVAETRANYYGSPYYSRSYYGGSAVYYPPTPTYSGTWHSTYPPHWCRP